MNISILTLLTWSNNTSGNCLMPFSPTSSLRRSYWFSNVSSFHDYVIVLTYVTFLDVDVPKQYRREAILCSLLLMPDEHIEVLQALLYFLQQVAKESSVNQMNETNLSMCFAPSLFHYTQCFSKQNAGSPHPKEIAENRAGHECLAYFLMNYDNLFNVSYITSLTFQTNNVCCCFV